MNSLLGALPEVLPGVAAVERDVPGKPVELAVLYCVAYRRGVVFYPESDLTRSEAIIPIVPVPLYASRSVSDSFSAAASTA